MALVCAISHEVPENPVISPASGSVFEKRLVEKYINENGPKDPINGEVLTIEMLVEIKTPPFVKAKAPTSTSIPGILKSLQDEWDALMLNTFTMRKQLQKARQELSHSLYQHDAACRVIARLTKEVTAAREALATLKPRQDQYATISGASEPGIAKVVGISDDVKQKLNDTAAVLTQERKKKAKYTPEELAQAESMRNYQTIASHTGLHSASSPGILCLDMFEDTIVTGGNDKAVTVFNRVTEQVVTSMKGHAKKIVQVLCHPREPIILSGSMDTTVKTWSLSNSQAIQTLKAHDAAITGLSLHATGEYILTGSMDHYWAFSNIQTGTILAKVCGDEDSPITSAKFHPDGLIFATGTLSAMVKIWDLKEQSNVATFQGHTGPVTGIAFSENGYYLATSAEDFTVKLWDLRKLKNFKTLNLDDGYITSDLVFDETGSYLGIAGNDIRIFGCKNWNLITTFNEHTASATGIRFGKNANYIVSTSLDRSLKVYGLMGNST